MRLLKELMEADVIDFASRAKGRQPTKTDSDGPRGQVTGLDDDRLKDKTPAIPEDIMLKVKENVQEVIDVITRAIDENATEDQINKIITYYLTILQHQYEAEKMMGMPGFTFATLNMIINHKDFNALNNSLKEKNGFSLDSKFKTLRNQIKNMMK